MPVIGVSDDVFEKVALLGQAWDVPPGQVINRLLGEFQRAGRARREENLEEGGIPVHAIYGDLRVEARFDPQTEHVTFHNGPLAGRTYRKPSGAAVALVASLNPSVKPNRNGWDFWTITDSGATLRSLRTF